MKNLKNIKTNLFLCSILLIMSCTNQKSQNDKTSILVKPYPHIINMRQGLSNNSQLRLSDIADSIKYIVLSKEKEVLIKSVHRLQMSDNELYINSEGLVMRFDLSGKYLNSFGSLGRGPEEYLSGSIYSITPKFDKVLILRSFMYDYLIYKPTGEYIGKKELSYSRNIYDFTFISDSSFLMTFWFMGTIMDEDILNAMPCIAGLYDIEGQLIEGIENPLAATKISNTDLKRVVIQNPSFTYFRNRVVLTLENDTIYEVDNNSISPGFIINWDKVPHKQNIEELYFRQTESNKKVRIYKPIFETQKGVYFRGDNMNDSFIFEYDKITGLNRSMITDASSHGFINDLDGGAVFFPTLTNREGDVWISREDAFSFKERHSEEFLSSSIALFPKMKNKLNVFLDSLKQDDNPVLKIVYLKKDSGRD